MKNYPRLTRASILISIALFADQFTKQNESSQVTGFNLFGFLKPVLANPDEYAEIVVPVN